MTRVLLIGNESQRLSEVVLSLSLAGYEATRVSVLDLDVEISDFAAIVVSADLQGEKGCAAVRTISCAPHAIPLVAETGSVCVHFNVTGECANPNHYAIDSLTSPTLPQLLATAVSHHREILRLRAEVEQRGSAIGLIMGGLFQVRTLSEARNLSAMLSLACADPGRVVVGLRELIVNAIEHGNLEITCEEKADLVRNGTWVDEIERRLAMPRYAERCVTVQFRRETSRGIFQIRDMGKGFDFERYMQFDATRLMAPNGRGIALASRLSFDSLTYIGAGNDVVAISNFAPARVKSAA